MDTFGTGLSHCDCQNSSFLNKDHGHILTGDLRIINNKHLRKLMSKGPNYREPKSINWNRCKDTIREGIKECSRKLSSSKKNVSENDLLGWETEVLNETERKIQSLKQKIRPKKTNPILKQQTVTNYLKELHSKFVLVPIDKASNNIAIICKRFYVEEILKEIGVIGEKSDTYVKSVKTKDEILEENIGYSQKLGFQINNNEKELPSMYWIPKLHKNPVGKRFIIASKTCSTKKLSKSISSVFKLIYHQVENFHKKSKFLDDYNKFWVLQNYNPVIKTLNKINKKKNAKSISTYDFSTLYTKLPHKKLVDKLSELIDFVYQGGNKNYIRINKYGKATWGKKGRTTIGFTKNSLKTAVIHLIENCYFTVGNITLKQAIGIPMGIDPAPFWANLFLYFYENKFITSLISTDKVKARHFHSTNRFIDDLCAINDGGEFGRMFKDIYPEELDLKVEHSGNYASFLNLDINIVNGQFIYKLYDKRDAFPFFIVRMPYVNSNIPEKIFYSALVGEMLRIARSTLRFSDFLPKACDLVSRMSKQGAQKTKCRSSLKKIINKHGTDFSKFNFDTNTFIEKYFWGHLIRTKS